MKRIIFLLSILCCNGAFADTINLHWLNEDGSIYQNSTCVIDSDLILPATPPTKYGYTFTGWKISDYISIEYLESTGTQYINTGILANNGNIVRIVSDIKYNTVNNGSNQFSGVYGGAYFGVSDGNWSNGGQSVGSADTLLHHFEFVAQIGTDGYVELNIDGSIYKYNRSVLDGQVGVFSLPGYSYFSSSKIYYFKIYINNILVRDFIPVLTPDGTPCMYDKVAEQFFCNQGTGQFVAGPVLTE